MTEIARPEPTPVPKYRATSSHSDRLKRNLCHHRSGAWRSDAMTMTPMVATMTPATACPGIVTGHPLK